MIQSRPRKKGGSWSFSDYTHRLPEITEEAKAIDATYILDGEIVFFNAEGISEFTPCQRRCSTQDLGKILYLKRKYPLNFLAFDILEWNESNLRDVPYLKRKAELESFLDNWLFPSSCIKIVVHSDNPKQLFEDTISRGGEGIILKRESSQYHEGIRSYSWLKIKLIQKEVCQVVGYTEGKNRRSKYFGSLVLTQNGKYVGNVGSGFSDHELAEITDHLKKCPRCKPPFQIDEPYTAVRTNLKVLVRFHKRTENGVFRFPSFLKVMES